MVDGNQDRKKISFNMSTEKAKTLELFQTRVCNISNFWQKYNFIFQLCYRIFFSFFLYFPEAFLVVIIFNFKSTWFLTKDWYKTLH